MRRCGASNWPDPNLEITNAGASTTSLTTTNNNSYVSEVLMGDFTMRRTLLAGMALASMTVVASAETEFNGALCFTSANAACVAQGWNAGGCFSTRYAPRNVGTNGPDTELSLFSDDFAVGFKLGSGNPVAATPFTVSMAKVARGGSTHPVGFRLTSQTPSAPNTATPTISMNGVFTNWDQITGCTMGFRSAATRHP